MGGLHRFMTWDGPILTDSGGFQIFSLAKLRKISEEGVKFNSHVDGRHIFMGPEESMRIQSNLGSDIAMAFDECVKIPSPRDYVQRSCDRTYRWLVRCRDALAAYNAEDDAVNPGQMLFGINQGAVFHDLRIEHMKQIAELELPGNYVLMKSASKMAAVKEILRRSGRRVSMVENCCMEGEKRYYGIEEIPDSAGYFSLIIAKEP